MADQITKDLGGITAYAAAVAAGYTGTKSQFETLMASYATVAQNAAASATAANGSAEDAEAYAVGTRDGSDVGSTDPAYHNNSKYYAELAEDFADSIDPDTLAKIDGYYQEMTVGDAEQIVSSILVEDKAPYQFRTAGGSVDIGKRAYFDAIVGGTVGWNQYVPTASKDYTSNNTDTRSFLYLVTQVYNGSTFIGNEYVSSSVAVGLKQFIFKASNNGTKAVYKHSGQTRDLTFAEFQANIVKDHIYLGTINFKGVDISTIGGVEAKDMQFTDITSFLGSTIADYIYSLEQATAGAGVAFFRKYFPNYYEYNAGSLESVEASAHKTVGFNQWDEEFESGTYSTTTGEKESSDILSRSKNLIRVLPNTVYYLKSGDGSKRLFYYDANKNLIRSDYRTDHGLFTTPADCCYFAFAMLNALFSEDVCINLSWDGSRDGEYEEYKEHTYPLDDSLTLRGIPKLVDGKLKFDGDEYYPIGTVIRRYGVVDLGSLTWGNATASGRTSATPNPLAKTVVDIPNLVCPRYVPMTRTGWYNADSGNGISVCGGGYGGDGNIGIVDSSFANKTGDEVKTALSGVYLVYELATATTEVADAYSGIQIVDDFGTEEFITDTVVPVGHVTHYPVNLVAKLEMMPNSPDGNGDYIVQQDSGINTYIPLASTDTITGIIARLEALEQAAGIGGE